MVTYNNVVKAFETFCSDHLQINSYFSSIQQWDIQASENLYPCIAFVPQPSTIRNGAIDLTFNFIVADNVKADLSNLNEVYSDMLSIMTDIASFFRNYEDDFIESIDDISIEPFIDKLPDFISGWIGSVTMRVVYYGDQCVIPLNNNI